jgi:hypothetical protein
MEVNIVLTTFAVAVVRIFFGKCIKRFISRICKVLAINFADQVIMAFVLLNDWRFFGICVVQHHAHQSRRKKTRMCRFLVTKRRRNLFVTLTAKGRHGDFFPLEIVSKPWNFKFFQTPLLISPTSGIFANHFQLRI